MCVQPSFETDGEALRNFLQFDTKVNIPCENKIGKTLALSITAAASLYIYKTDSNGSIIFIREHRSANSLFYFFFKECKALSNVERAELLQGKGMRHNSKKNKVC